MNASRTIHERQGSRELTSGAPEMSSPSRSTHRRQPPRWTRTRNACERCKTRKIKCDEGVPSCSSCQKAGTTCLTVGHQQDERHSRAYLSSLQERIRWLEDIVTTRCPDVDLTRGPTISHDPSVRDDISLSRTSETPQQQQQQQPTVEDPHRENLAHEIGLVSVAVGQDQRYIGPSSGYSFAKMLLNSARQRQQRRLQPQKRSFQSIPLLDKENFRVPPAKPPSSLEQCMQLSAAYWETLHYQYPFLHQHTHAKLIEHMYQTGTPSPIAAFQVYMVLAIATTILSRRLKVPLSAEGYGATAMTYFDEIQIEGSLEGLQCLLLLQMYAFNNASMGLNVWYLNYQCIASALDLGLQRDVRRNNLSSLTQEIRTRVFWVVYHLDRTLSTIMGRPIGLRDEACELRLPRAIDDDLIQGQMAASSILISIHLFKLAQLNSEIKYIANSISREAPPYSYPQIPDVTAWKDDVLRRLRQWRSETPECTNLRITKVIEIKYHKVVMLLLRPSPAIPQPSPESLQLCFESAATVIRALDELYRGDSLPYTWPTIHSVFLATITMLYCIWTVPSIAEATKLDTLMTDLKGASSVLSALGEHWLEAKRSRELLDELSQTTVRWLIEHQMRGSTAVSNMPIRSSLSESSVLAIGITQEPNLAVEQPAGASNPSTLSDFGLISEPLASTFTFFDISNPVFDIDSLLQGVFTDYQPDVEFGQNFPLETDIADDFTV